LIERLVKVKSKGKEFLHFKVYILTPYDVWTSNILIKMTEADFSKISKLTPILTNFFLFWRLSKKSEYCINIFNYVQHRIIQV
jgi:hypothetical protein